MLQFVPVALISTPSHCFSNESTLPMRWSKYWSFSISPSNEHPGLISFRMDWLDLSGESKKKLSSSVSRSVMSDSETPWTVACQAPLSLGFPRQEYWYGLPCSPPGDLPDPGDELVCPTLAGGFFTTEPREMRCMWLAPLKSWPEPWLQRESGKCHF